LQLTQNFIVCIEFLLHLQQRVKMHVTRYDKLIINTSSPLCFSRHIGEFYFMAKSKNPTKIKDLVPDNKNFNKGSEFGNSLIEKSFRKFGAGRSILIDKNNRIIAGNKSIENAGAIGMDDVRIVESDGTKIIAVKRIDIDLDSPIGREMALADNASAKANIVFDAELIEAELSEAVAVEWGASCEFIEKEKKQSEKDLLEGRKTHICPNCNTEFDDE